MRRFFALCVFGICNAATAAAPVPEAPCCAPAGSPATRWVFDAVTDAMTGEKLCSALSPISSVWVSELKTSADVRLAVVFVGKKVAVLAKIESKGAGSPIFHSTAGGMGVKAGDRFYPLTRRMGQKAIAASDSGALADALLLSTDARMRLLFWPYETNYDTPKFSNAGLVDAVQRAAKCAGGL